MTIDEDDAIELSDIVSGAPSGRKLTPNDLESGKTKKSPQKY